jgi:hypothetical protein
MTEYSRVQLNLVGPNLYEGSFRITLWGRSWVERSGPMDWDDAWLWLLRITHRWPTLGIALRDFYESKNDCMDAKQ